MRVLEAFGEPLSYGGQEAFVMNMLGCMDRTDMTIDLLSPYYCDNERLISTIGEYGGEVYTLGCSFRPGSVRLGAVKPVIQFLKTHKYDVIHIHSGSSSMLAILAWAAGSSGIPGIIVHSHCTGMHGWKHSVSKVLTAPALAKYPSEYCACSGEAGEWRFSRKICRDRLKIIPNGIEPERFLYDADKRSAVRKELGIEDDNIVIGNVGRLSFQKNQSFLLYLLKEIKGADGPDSNCYKLLLVGNGEDMAELKTKAAELGIGEDVIFTGARNNVSDYYQAIDVLAVPSRFEGLGMVVIEGQAAGLDVIASEGVPQTADVTGSVSFISLDDSEGWIKALTAPHKRHYEYNAMVKASGFTAASSAEIVRDMYCKWKA